MLMFFSVLCALCIILNPVYNIMYCKYVGTYILHEASYAYIIYETAAAPLAVTKIRHKIDIQYILSLNVRRNCKHFSVA